MSDERALLILGGILLILLTLMLFIDIWQRKAREWDARIAQMEARHAAEKSALDCYAETVRRYIDHKATLKEANEAYLTYIKVCYPEMLRQAKAAVEQQAGVNGKQAAE